MRPRRRYVRIVMKHVASLVGLMLGFPGIAQAKEFKAKQLTYKRVRGASAEKADLVKKTFEAAGIAYPPDKIFVRIFKRENQVELWAVRGRNKPMSLVKTYPVCYASGDVGPKRRQGDEQVPEGFYHIDRFNPWSNFHLSLGINYPNRSDRILGYKRSLGGDIFIHGSCVSIGCVAITDDLIKELYLIAVDTRDRGQRRIPVHIFPTKMDEEGMKWLKKKARDEPHGDFWANLKGGYDYFEKDRKLPRVSVGRDGRYRFR